MPPAPLHALIANLARAYPRQAITAETLAVYVEHLSDIPDDLLADIGREWIRTERFFPSIAELRNAAAERALLLPSDEQALAQVMARVAYRGGPEDAPDVHPLAVAAVRGVGGFSALRSSEKPEVVVSQFLRFYREARADALRNAQVGDMSRALPRGDT